MDNSSISAAASSNRSPCLLSEVDKDDNFYLIVTFPGGKIRIFEVNFCLIQCYTMLIYEMIIQITLILHSEYYENRDCPSIDFLTRELRFQISPLRTG